MGDVLGFFIIVALVIFGLPVLIAVTLFSRTSRLRAEVNDLRLRVRTLELGQVPAPHVPPAPVVPVVARPQPVTETPGSSRLQAGDADPPPPPPPPLPPERGTYLPPLPPPRPADVEPESLESRIGGRWLLNIGIAAIVIGVAYFEKLAIDNQWIGETARVIQGGILGAALIYLGGRFARKGYDLYGQMMTGGGVAILYVSIYAAFIFYQLIARGPAFALMIGVTALGAWLADRHNSQGLAVLAVGGGFITPFLLRGNTDQQIALFTYVAVMVSGTVFLAQRRSWPLLNIISYVFTVITIAAWADRFYTPEKYLVTELFLTLFCAMFMAIAWRVRREAEGFDQFAAWFLWTAPAAYYVASLGVLSDHSMAMLVWLIGVALVSGVLSVIAAGGAELVVWVAAALPLLGWTTTHASAVWLAPGLVTIGAIYGIALAAQLRQAGEGQPPSGVNITWMHLNALLMFAGAYFLLEKTHLAATGPVAALFAVWHGVLAAVFWTRDRDRAVHFTALAFTLLTIAIGLEYDGPAVTMGWAVEGAAVIALGLFVRRDWLRAGGALLFGASLVWTLDLLLSTVPANHVVFLNRRAACALLVAGLCYAIAWLHRRAAEASGRTAAIGATLIAAQVVSVILLTSEIHAYFAVHGVTLTREVMVSVMWAVYATVLIVIGLRRNYAPIRYFAIGLFAVTIGKVFFSDLAELQRIYRVMSLIALGITLLLTSYLYQKMRTELRDEPANSP